MWWTIGIGMLLTVINLAWGQIAPFPQAPACPPEAHTPTQFHTLWNSALGCHYDHEHGEPYPQWAEQLFGDYTQFTGAELSYPWQTPNENQVKHEGYKLFHKDLRLGAPYSSDYASSTDPCPPFTTLQDITPGGPSSYLMRVVAYSLQTHNLAHAHEAMTRKHSYWAMLYVCDPATNQFGTIMTGGHADYGQRISPYQGPLLALPDQPQPAYPVAREPYLAHPCADPLCGDFTKRQNRKIATGATWTNEPIHVTSANKIVNFSFRIRNPFDGIADRFATPEPVWLCTRDGGHTYHQPGCYTTGTQHNFFQMRGWGVPLALTTPANPFATFTGFTDLQGNLAPGCTAASSTCVPLQLDNARLGALIGDDQEKVFNLKAFDKSLFTERNICFNVAGQPADCEALGSTPAGWIGEEN